MAEQGSAAVTALSRSAANKAVLKAAGTKWAIHKLPSAQASQQQQLPEQQQIASQGLASLSQQPQQAHSPASLAGQSERADSAQGTSATELYQHLSDSSHPGQEGASKPAFIAKPSRFAAGRDAPPESIPQSEHVQSVAAAAAAAAATVKGVATAKHDEVPVVRDMASNYAAVEESMQAGAAQQQQPDADTAAVAPAGQGSASHDAVITHPRNARATRKKKTAFACKRKVQLRRPVLDSGHQAVMDHCFGRDSQSDGTQSEGTQSEPEPDEHHAAAPAVARSAAAGAPEAKAADAALECVVAATVTTSAAAAAAASAVPTAIAAAPTTVIPASTASSPATAHSAAAPAAAAASAMHSGSSSPPAADATEVVPPEAATSPAQGATAPAQAAIAPAQAATAAAHAVDTAPKVEHSPEAVQQSADKPGSPEFDGAQVSPDKVKTAKRAQLSKPSLKATASKTKTPAMKTNASPARSNSKHVSYTLLSQLLLSTFWHFFGRVSMVALACMQLHHSAGCTSFESLSVSMCACVRHVCSVLSI